MSPGTFGIISPHPPIMVEAVGGPRARVTSSSVAALHVAGAALAAYDPDLVLVMSPHSPAYADAFLVDTAARTSGSFAQFGAPEARYAYNGDPEYARELLALLARDGIDAIDRATDVRMQSGQLDHGVLVPMTFLDVKGRWPIVELSLSYLSYATHRRLGELVAQAAESLGRRLAFVASGDLSHRLTRDAPAGYSPLAADLDEAIVDGVRLGDFVGLMHLDPEMVEAGGECGLRSFITLGGFLGEGAPTRVLSYEGPWGVGYLTALAGVDAVRLGAETSAGVAAESGTSGSGIDDTPPIGRKGGTAGSDESDIVRLARQTIEAYVRQRRVLEPQPLGGDELPERAGAFVSLHRGGQLRGCIGTILPTQDTLAEEVVHNAIQAATQDPRFPPMSPSELEDLDVKVDVLREPESCKIDDLDPKQYGVIVSAGWRRGLLLPDLEGVDDVITQVEIAMRKAGIRPGETCSYERFQVDRYE
jgi:AmmeMemoRadiSam system protein A